MSGPSFSLDQVYQPRTSPVHGLDPRVRVVIATGFVVSVAALAPPGWAAFGLLEALLLATSAGARLGVLFPLGRAVIALPFVLAALPLAFTTPGTPLLHVPLLGDVTAAGLERGGVVLARAGLSVQAVILLTATTRFPDLLWALGRLGVPQTLVVIIGLAYRYLFVLGEEVLRMRRARAARSGRTAGDPGRPPAAWQAQVAGRMAGTLLVRALERSERVYLAMAARGFDGTPRGFERGAPPWRDIAVGAGATITLALIAWGSWRVPLLLG